MKKLIAMLLVLVMILSVMAGCGGGGETQPSNEGTQGSASTQGTQGADATGGATEPAADNEPKYGGHLNVQIAGALAGFDPVKRAAVWIYMPMTCVYEPPLSRDAENEIAPGVCDYEVNEDMTVVKLWPREGVKFHDGTLVEAEDVKASIERACKLGNGVKRYLAPVIESMVVENNVLTITFTKNDEAAWSRLASWQTWAGVMPKEICEMYPSSEVNDLQHAIGTGPYKIVDFATQNYMELERFEDYVPVTEDRSGYAGIKHAYLDTITFWKNSDYSSGTMAMLAGQYDICDVIEPEYEQMAKQAGIIRENMGQCQTAYLAYLNTSGGDNLCNKYPDLRRAIMAAIDMSVFANKITDGAVSECTGQAPVLDEKYQTDFYNQTDWYGPTNQAAVDKYLEAARAQGYKDEPIQIVCSSLSESWTMLTGYLENAGINYYLNMMDSASASEFTTDGMNNWDIKFSYESVGHTPTTLGDAVSTKYYVSAERDALYAELRELEVGSDEYIAKWHELHQLWVDDCSLVPFGILDWYWNHREDLHCDYEGEQAYFFNSWWDDPSQHKK